MTKFTCELCRDTIEIDNPEVLEDFNPEEEVLLCNNCFATLTAFMEMDEDDSTDAPVQE